MIDPRVAAAGIDQADLIAQEALALLVGQLREEAKKLAEFLTENLKQNDTALAVEELKIMHAQLVTAEGRYQVPRLIDQTEYLASMLDQADQRPGQDAYDRFIELKNELDEIRKRAGSPGITD
jgi:hypothetical protein